jgi:hypothetical protein
VNSCPEGLSRLCIAMTLQCRRAIVSQRPFRDNNGKISEDFNAPPILFLGAGDTSIVGESQADGVDFPARWGNIEIEAGLKAPFLFNGPPWSRNKTRVSRSQFATIPP